jgi:ATP-dependent Clp protease ATP-binding subunit ClpA
MTGRSLVLVAAWLWSATITIISSHGLVAAFSTSPLLLCTRSTCASSSSSTSIIILAMSSSSSSMGNEKSIIDALSDDCVAAIKASHDIGNDMGMTTLTKELLFAGIVRHPERARKTLTKYNVDPDEVRQAAMDVLRYAPGITLQSPSSSSSSPSEQEQQQQQQQQQGKTKKPLPFSDDAKLLLNKALAIAESMESSSPYSGVTRSEHVLLALMGYNYGNKIDNSPILNVLQKTKSISRTDAGFKVFNFCDDLVNDLPLTPTTTVGREAVVVIGKSSSSGTTNTLAEVGVDMTQMAMEGKYDAVFGRNDEIRSVLRTLGRRRKNNPCLIGGKYNIYL